MHWVYLFVFCFFRRPRPVCVTVVVCVKRGLCSCATCVTSSDSESVPNLREQPRIIFVLLQCSGYNSTILETIAPSGKIQLSRCRGIRSATPVYARHFVDCCFSACVFFELLGEDKFAPINLFVLQDSCVVFGYVTSGRGAG